MQYTPELLDILITRHYLINTTEETLTTKAKYYNAYLLSNFGIVVDKPAFVNQEMLELISSKFHLNIPKSFYTNPQDTKFFTKDELLIEQLISYFAYGSDLGRIELFKKAVPEYTVGDELKLRTFYIVDDAEATKILEDIMNSYCAYTRPFSLDELGEFLALFAEGFYSGADIKCKDNIFNLLGIDASFARFLDKKDIVKLSVRKFGDKASFRNIEKNTYMWRELKSQFNELGTYIPYVKHCPMSKKQAKYFNKICQLSGVKQPKMTNAQSPDRRANKFLSEGNVVAAAQIYSENGSMLERRVKMLLSRANPIEAAQILEMLPANNPIALYQMISNLVTDDNNARIFTFYHNNKVKRHKETEYEQTWRKSKLNDSTRKLLKDICIKKIKEYYRNLPSFGKVAIEKNFYKLGLPTNTSASGKGIDVLPTGSRIPVRAANVRTFVHWKNAFDIDSSLIIVDGNNNITTQGWFNYSSKSFGNSVLFSGDITGREGAEFFDIKLDKLREAGYKYVIQTFHGYNSKLDSGEIYAGYQVKSDLNTKAWDPKNIEFQFRVQGDSRGCVAFAIDLETMEVVILNQIIESDERIVNPDGFKTIEKFLNSEYLEINIGEIIEARTETFVLRYEDADAVFSDTYMPAANSEQLVVRSWELEKLVKLINE